MPSAETGTQLTAASRSLGQAMLRGARNRCPRCGTGKVFRGFLKVNPQCSNCGLELHHHRADDAPPYVVMVVVGHIVISGVLSLELTSSPPFWVQAALWIPATIVLSLAMLQPVKGALISLQWAFRMHGFGGTDSDPTAVTAS